MAKMFYTLEETAARLGVGEDQVKEMASEGKLQQFRDRDKLMFKRDQVDALAGSTGSAGSAAGGSGVGLADTAGDSVDILGDTDAVNPSDATDSGQQQGGGQSQQGTGTGVNVFEADEVSEPADPGAQTQITQPSGSSEDEELSLESVGSGSGLLDLTRESDDTSLGVALDEIYPGGSQADKTGQQTAEGGGGGTSMESAVGSSGVFESALGMESAAGQTAASSGLDNLAGEEGATAPTAAATQTYEPDPYDPAGSGLSAGLLIGALVALVLGLMVVVSQLVGGPSPVTDMFAGQGMGMFAAYLGGLAAISIILGVIGMVVGKAAAR